MNITFKGAPITLLGKKVEIGDLAPNFTLVGNDMQAITLNDTKGKRVFVVVPSLDTPVCDLEVKTFNAKAAELPDVTIYVISVDLPFAQSRWCGATNSDKVVTLSDYKDRSFGENYGVLIKELGLLTRAVFVVDENNKVTYVEYVSEVKNPPNFEEVYKALQML